jgi:hypothetical protein
LSSVADAWRNSGRAAPPSDFVAIASSFFIDYNVFFFKRKTLLPVSLTGLYARYEWYNTSSGWVR